MKGYPKKCWPNQINFVVCTEFWLARISPLGSDGPVWRDPASHAVKFFVKMYFCLYERRASPSWRDLATDYTRFHLGGLYIFHLIALIKGLSLLYGRGPPYKHPPKIGFSSLREITNNWRPHCSWLTLLSSIFFKQDLTAMTYNNPILNTT